MSVKKIFTWIYLLCKHILKMPVIFILLLIIPAVTLTFRLLPGSASQTDIYAGNNTAKDNAPVLRGILVFVCRIRRP